METTVTCSCCEKVHHTAANLVHIGTNWIGPHYNCDCGSTMIIADEIIGKLEKQAEEEQAEEDLFYKEHTYWGRI